MSNGDKERKSHITRIYKDDDSSGDQWIDIERLDELPFKSGRGYQYRFKRWEFKWDEFNPDDAEVVTKKRISHPDDENTWVEIPVRDRIDVHEGSGESYQGNKLKFNNTDSNTHRKTHSHRVYHHDIDDKYLDGGGQPPSDPQEYLKALGDQDIDQYVDVELIGRHLTEENESHTAQGKSKRSSWQDKKWYLSEDDPLLQDPMLPTDKADPSFSPTLNPEAGPIVDPPWRLDPLQNIVNVSWGDGAVIFGKQNTDAPEQEKK